MALTTEYGTLRKETLLVKYYPRQGLYRLNVNDIESVWEEAEEYFKRKDYVQACEKYYKVAEECVKILSEQYAPNVIKEVKKIGNWVTPLLYRAVSDIVKNIGWEGRLEEDIFREGWKSAVELHIKGFHEYSLDESTIKYDKDKVEKMKNLVEKKLREIERNIFSGNTASLSSFSNMIF